jgi:hypothetical protein
MRFVRILSITAIQLDIDAWWPVSEAWNKNKLFHAFISKDDHASLLSLEMAHPLSLLATTDNTSIPAIQREGRPNRGLGGGLYCCVG